MKVKATFDQIKQIAVNAINASQPMGMGFLHFEEKDYTIDDLKIFDPNHISLDYFHGRMVKLSIRHIRNGDEWGFSDTVPTRDYQSWASKYPTYQDLINSVPGVTIL